jgi:pilus assembly protein CpaB
MNKRLAGVLAFALIVSAGASFLLYRLISARLAAEAKPASTQVFVATRNLETGTLIKEADIRAVDWPGTVPQQAVTNQEDIVGRGVVATIYQGEPIVDTRLAAKGAGAGLAAIIPTGMRAVAIRVNDVTALAGYVTPGMRVDILILGTPPNGPQALGTQTKTLLQNIEVLSAGQQIQKDSEGKPIPVGVVNVLVTPEQAEILSLASNDARIQLVLRNPLDTEKAKPPGTAMAKIWAGPQPPQPPTPTISRPRPSRPKFVPVRAAPPPPAAKKKDNTIIVEIITGSAKKEAKFEEVSEEK